MPYKIVCYGQRIDNGEILKMEQTGNFLTARDAVPHAQQVVQKVAITAEVRKADDPDAEPQYHVVKISHAMVVHYDPNAEAEGEEAAEGNGQVAKPHLVIPGRQN